MPQGLVIENKQRPLPSWSACKAKLMRQAKLPNKKNKYYMHVL
jgi:hypothetical protein